MELAGRTIPTEAEQTAQRLAAEYTAQIATGTPGTVAAYKADFANLASSSIETAIALTEALSFSNDLTMSQIVAPYSAMALRAHDLEVGNRMIYSFLGNPELMHNMMENINHEYRSARLSYEEYQPWNMKYLLETLHERLRMQPATARW